MLSNEPLQCQHINLCLAFSQAGMIRLLMSDINVAALRKRGYFAERLVSSVGINIDPTFVSDTFTEMGCSKWRSSWPMTKNSL